MAMAPRGIEMLLSVFLVMSFWGETVVLAQYSESSCTNVLLSLSPCLDYITEKASTPSSECCSQLAYVVGSQPQCLCEVVNGGASSIGASLNINQTQALALPSACRVQTPPISICSSSSASGSSVSSPTGVSVSNIPNSPAGFGSNIVSSTTGGSGGGSSFHWNSSSTKLTSSLLVLFLFATTLTFHLFLDHNII